MPFLYVHQYHAKYVTDEPMSEMAVNIMHLIGLISVSLIHCNLNIDLWVSKNYFLLQEGGLSLRSIN